MVIMTITQAVRMPDRWCCSHRHSQIGVKGDGHNHDYRTNVAVLRSHTVGYEPTMMTPTITIKCLLSRPKFGSMGLMNWPFSVHHSRSQMSTVRAKTITVDSILPRPTPNTTIVLHLEREWRTPCGMFGEAGVPLYLYYRWSHRATKCTTSAIRVMKLESP
jgi:hypothetical protein